MLTVFKFNRVIVNNTSKYNIAKGLDLKKPIQFIKITFFVKISMKIKKILDIQHTRTRFTGYQVRA